MERNNDALHTALVTIAGSYPRAVTYGTASRPTTANTLPRTRRGRRWQQARAILAQGFHIYLP